MGFEPTYDGFANRCQPLGCRAEWLELTALLRVGELSRCGALLTSTRGRWPLFNERTARCASTYMRTFCTRRRLHARRSECTLAFQALPVEECDWLTAAEPTLAGYYAAAEQRTA